MAIEYLGFSSINGPLIALEGVQDAFYDEIVEFVVNGKEHKMGRIVEVYKTKQSSRYLKARKICPEQYAHQTYRPSDGDRAFRKYLEEPLTGSDEPIDDLGPIDHG